MNRPSTKLSVVIPVYNERQTVAKIVARALKVDLGPLEREVIIVDDGSTDGTDEILKSVRELPDVKVFTQPMNLGKGAAVTRGFRESVGDVVLVQDADLEYNPSEYPILLRPILDGEADVVYGSRFLGSRDGSRVLYFWHSVGNKLLTLFSNACTDLNLTDMETCYKAMTRDIVDRLDLQSRGFGMEPEITCKVARLRARIFEVPISYRGRTYDEGKKIGLKDAFVALWTILRFAYWTPPPRER